jgi:hypothetical protein
MPVLIVIVMVLVACWLLMLLAWVAFVYFVRFLGLIFGYSVVVAALTFAAGLGWGIVLPFRVLRGRSRTVGDVATPQRVRDGAVFRSAPKNASANFGWDLAWPLYAPHQLRYDAVALRAESRRLAGEIVQKTRSWWPRPNRWYLKAMTKPLWLVVLGIPTYGLCLGIWTGLILWLVIQGLFGAVVSAAQGATMLLLRAREARFMKTQHAAVRCTRCYRSTVMPSYRCSNDACSVVHRDVSPGPLGVRTRVCVCETRLPMTAVAASRTLTAVCPFCAEDLPQSSGTRRVVVVPVFGSVGSGKTQLLSTAAVELHNKSLDATESVSFTPLNRAAQGFLTAAVDEASIGRAPNKTQHVERPEGYPFLVDYSGGDFELQLMDAAGESFVSAEDSRTLGYLDISDSLLFVFDPLALPEVGEQLALGATPQHAPVAQGSASDAYGSVVDRLRDGGDDLSGKRIGVVVTKADVIAAIMPQDALPEQSDGIRTWVYGHGGDALIRRIEMDFDDVTYFATDAVQSTSAEDPFHPLRVVDWAVVGHGGATLYPPAPQAETPSAATTAAAGDPGAAGAATEAEPSNDKEAVK